MSHIMIVFSFFPEVLHRPGSDLYLKVPVRYDKNMIRENLVEACQDAGLLPLCKNKNEGESGDCLIMELDNGKTDRFQLIREVCLDVAWSGDYTPKSICPKIDGAFFYNTNGNGEGILTKSNGDMAIGATGAYFVSGEQLKPYYAACGKVGGTNNAGDLD